VGALKTREDSSRVFNARIFIGSVPGVARLATFSAPLRGEKQFPNSFLVPETGPFRAAQSVSIERDSSAGIQTFLRRRALRVARAVFDLVLGRLAAPLACLPLLVQSPEERQLALGLVLTLEA
jgi:hypothetical protein